MLPSSRRRQPTGGACATTLLQVTIISTSPGKKEEAISRLGADKFVVSKDPEQMGAAAGTLHGIIDTVSGAGRGLGVGVWSERLPCADV